MEVIDKYTIRIELKEEEAFFEYNLIFPIVSSKQYKNKSFNYTSTPVGTGKYKITKTENDKIELSRNDNWRDIDIENSNLKTIYINIYDSRGKEYNSFKELEEKLSGIIYANNTEKVVNLKIEWKWDYESGSTIEEITNNDILDTKDAQTIQDYKFVINVSGEQI